MHRANSVYEPIPAENFSSRHHSHSAVHGGSEAHPLSASDVQPGRAVLPDTEFLLSGLRVATLRAKLVANELDSIGVALKARSRFV